MKNQKSNKIYKVYIHQMKEMVEVTEEQYNAYYRDIWATCKKMQRHGRCACPKSMLWICDADCAVCPYSSCGDTVSIDIPIDNTEDLTFGDTLISDEPTPESIAVNEALLKTLYEEIDRLDPEGKKICELIMDGKSEREMAEDMDKRQSTVNYKKKRVLNLLHEALKDFI